MSSPLYQTLALTPLFSFFLLFQKFVAVENKYSVLGLPGNNLSRPRSATPLRIKCSSPKSMYHFNTFKPYWILSHNSFSMQELAPLMHVFFFCGRRDFNIGFSGRDMSMNVWNWLSGCSLVDIGIWIILLFYHRSNSKMIHMLFVYDYNTEYTTTHFATCYDVHVYINIIRKLWLRFNLTIVYQSL